VKIYTKHLEEMRLKNMSLDFVAIDFETANSKRSSPCSVGMARVENGIIVDTYYSLINPECQFDAYNMYIHGITPEMVVTEKIYPDIAKDILTFSTDLPLVAHYAPFDMGVIKDSNARYNISDFRKKYFDSYYLAKQYISALSYKLNHLANQIGFSFEHHNALADAEACANLVNYLCTTNSFNCIDELISSAKYKKFGVIDGYNGSGFIKSKIYGNKSENYTQYVQQLLESVDPSSLDTTHIFYQKKACFTGTLKSMARKQAMAIFAMLGGIPEKNITKTTNFLIMGDQDIRVVGETGKSSKILKAEQLLTKGQEIQLLSENEFLRMIE